MWLDLIMHCFVFLSQKEETQLKGSPSLDMDRKLDMLTDSYETSNSITNIRQSSAAYHTIQSEPPPFPNNSFHVLPPPRIVAKGVPPIRLAASDSLAPYQY